MIALSEFQQFSPEKMKKNNLFQTPRFFCDIYCFEPGQEQKGHVHGEQDKVYLVLEGQGTFQVGSEKQILGPGPRVPWPQPAMNMGSRTTQTDDSRCWYLSRPIKPKSNWHPPSSVRRHHAPHLFPLHRVNRERLRPPRARPPIR